MPCQFVLTVGILSLQSTDFLWQREWEEESAQMKYKWMLFIKKKCIYRWQIFQARFPYNFQFLCFTENKIMKQILKITFEKTITDGDAYLYTH